MRPRGRYSEGAWTLPRAGAGGAAGPMRCRQGPRRVPSHPDPGARLILPPPARPSVPASCFPRRAVNALRLGSSSRSGSPGCLEECCCCWGGGSPPAPPGAESPLPAQRGLTAGCGGQRPLDCSWVQACALPCSQFGTRAEVAPEGLRGPAVSSAPVTVGTPRLPPLPTSLSLESPWHEAACQGHRRQL